MSNLDQEVEYYYDCDGDYHLVVELMDNTTGELFMYDNGVRYTGTAAGLCKVIASTIDTDFSIDAYRAMGYIRNLLVMDFGDEARNYIEDLYEVLWK